MQENYVGKSLEFIEDDLMRRIDDYENEASKWGFEIREAALTNIFGSKSMPMIAGSTLLAALAGSPVVATSAAIAGSIFELGKVAIAVSRKRFERYVALRDSPVSYITTAISELEKPKDS